MESVNTPQNSSSPWMVSVLVPIVVALIGLAGVIVTATIANSAKPSQSSTTTTFPVDARQRWQDTGFSVKKGDRISLQVVGGMWTAWRYYMANEEKPERLNGAQVIVNGSLENNGTGGNYLCDSPDCPLKNEHLGLLVGKIDNTPPFVIGSEKVIVAPYDGKLSLMMNDVNLEDNFGVLSVKIIINP